MNELLTPQQVAERFGISKKTLNEWRYKGYGPDFMRIGSAGRRPVIRYHTEAIRKYEQERTVKRQSA